ncbi:hypothetical protein [Hyphomicrobium sp. D-2]|uniref:hypothetical protein n=1 Tax=Hyphomicrobium sp. D-2 TaxID=3041621 RepID=UPI0024579685|nr:hypothetical protein [Hyphomicrobium sp. D-2]MDH4981466.1 hypothetical protein [Hyphomicrobium sp. D-2]
MSDDNSESATAKNAVSSAIEQMSDEHAAEVAKLVAEDQARRHQDVRDRETVSHGSDNEARETIRRRFGYTPSF